MSTLLATVVDASAAVAGTRSRSAKVGILAELLRGLAPDEVAVCAGLLAGEPRQGRVGVGHATVYGIDALPAAEATLTVGDLDTLIDGLAADRGPGSATRRRELLEQTLRLATASEAQFIRRLLTGDLRQGALAGMMVDAVASAAGVSATIARRALMLSGDLPRTAQLAISEGEPGLRAVGLELFRPVLPMLASPGERVADAVAAFACASVEFKLDGLRVQIHRRGNEVRIYSRNLNDITARLPGVVAAVLALPADAAILDGEALWMGADGPASFQETMSQVDGDAPVEGIATFLFDILHLDGHDLLDSPLRARRAELQTLAPDLVVPGTLTADVADAQEVLAAALRAGHEGVVVKDAQSPYAAGRRGAAWRKVKPALTYDLVVLAAEWGHGRRRGWLSNLHLGARDPATGTLVMVGKTFKGLTDALLRWQTDALLARATARDGITVHVAPELVVEIAIDGVQASTRYPGGLALRFARVRRYRPDKDAAEADTIDALRSLLHSARSGPA